MERLTKNFAWLAAANIVGSLFAALLFIYLARVLGAESFGYLSYAASIVFYLFNFIDLGLSTYGIREVAKDHDAVSEYVSNIVSFKVLVACALFTLFIAVTFFTSHSVLLKLLLAEVALLFFTSALATEWAFQGREMMYMVFISFAVTPLLQLVMSVLFVKGPADLLKVPIITFLGALPVIAAFLKILRFRPKFSGIHFKTIRLYMSSSIVIWAISMFTQTYNGLDIVILGLFRRPEEVGCFTVARRIIGGAAFLLVFLANALLPRLASTFHRDASQFARSTRQFLKVGGLVIVLVFLPVIFFSGDLISFTVGSQYLPASLPLKVMAMALVLVVCNMPYSTGLIAARFEREVLKQAAASAALSIILNFILIPKYGMMGASISFFMAEFLALAWILRAYHKKIGFRVG